MLDLSNFSTVGTILSFIFSPLIAIAINLDCRARNIASRKIYTILAVFFPLIVGIVYAVKRKGAQKAFKVCGTCGKHTGAYANKCPFCGGYTLYEYKNEKAKTLKTISVILCVIGIASWVASSVIDFPNYVENIKSIISGDYIDENEYAQSEAYDTNELFYDRNGIAYTDYNAVKYYSKDGTEYKYDYDNGFYDVATNSYLDENNCFVDSEGYFCYISDGSVKPIDDDPFESSGLDENGNETKYNVTYSDSEGNKYYIANEVYWNYSGRLCVLGFDGQTVD